MHKINKHPTGLCSIGNKDETVTHFLLKCAAIIIIIIKKVKIIVTLSIKNTAGAHYKSQIKGENRYCLWLRNSNVFRRRRKQSSDGA